ncbi:MAG: tRNA (adenosine(37)-N6)-dimethylallyltransferase MiaA, partial [bacterium]|nr:tRNA (adenosine(37)-N6)-dimethylallyltransferase MiaA [bacterium]
MVGPTSSGKSALAVDLARRFVGEVISADSRQVYRGLDIGTGKITKREMRGVPHHLLDVASPKRVFTAADYVRLARRACSGILQNTRIPIVAGGTGFYIDALVGRTSLPDVPVNKKLRMLLDKKTTAQLFALLKKRDPRRAKTIDRHNKHRLIRALEIAHAVGRVPMIELRTQSFDTLWIGIAPPMDKLRADIARRLRARLRRGMVAEAKRLHARGLSYRRMESLGLE